MSSNDAAPDASVAESAAGWYKIRDPRTLVTPAVLLSPTLIKQHLADAIKAAGGPDRLRPHSKTHKTRELALMELGAGMARHKCATLREADLLASAGVPDVLIAYPLVGPNVGLFLALAQKHPKTVFRALVDHPQAARFLSQRAAATSTSVSVLLDLDVGMGRTGVAVESAADLYELIAGLPGLAADGLHVYDGHVTQSDAGERSRGVRDIWRTVRTLLQELNGRGLPVSRIICGGTGSFPEWARIAAEDPRVECSPGTFFLNDWTYYDRYRDLPFLPAAIVATRIVSKPRAGRLTLDAGSKAVAPDPPLERRLKLLEIPDARLLWQNEEHLVIETAMAERLDLGAVVYGWPGHICPTCALHERLWLVEDHAIIGSWEVAARDRRLDLPG